MRDPIRLHDLIRTPGGLGMVQGRLVRRSRVMVIVSHTLNPIASGITELTAYRLDQVCKVPINNRRS